MSPATNSSEQPNAPTTPPGGHLAYQTLHAHLGVLKLNTIESIVDSYLGSAMAEGKSVVEIVHYLIEQEVRTRQAAALEARLQMAHFPARKRLEDFDLSAQPSVDPQVLQELRTLRFVHEKANVVALGPPGVGKTHLAIGLGIEAAKAGFRVYYSSALDLIADLKRSSDIDRLTRRLAFYGNVGVLIVDEIGYHPLDRVGAHLFFQLVNTRYERGSTIFTSNKPFSEWGEVLSDSIIAAATLDRILHHATVLSIKGESYRLKGRRRLGYPTPSPAVPLQSGHGSREA